MRQTACDARGSTERDTCRLHSTFDNIRQSPRPFHAMSLRGLTSTNKFVFGCTELVNQSTLVSHPSRTTARNTTQDTHHGTDVSDTMEHNTRDHTSEIRAHGGNTRNTDSHANTFEMPSKHTDAQDKQRQHHHRVVVRTSTAA